MGTWNFESELQFIDWGNINWVRQDYRMGKRVVRNPPYFNNYLMSYDSLFNLCEDSLEQGIPGAISGEESDSMECLNFDYATYEYDSQAARFKGQSQAFEKSEPQEAVTTCDSKNETLTKQSSTTTSTPENRDSISVLQTKQPIEEQKKNIIQCCIDIAIKKRNSAKKVNSKNRILDLFFPKFKQFIKDHLLFHHPKLEACLKDLLEALGRLPGMKKIKNNQALKELLQVKEVCGVEVDMLSLAEFYLQSNISVIDSFFPLENSNGKFRKNMFGEKSTTDYISFLPIYQMMIKFQTKSGEVEHDISFQSCWYYGDTTNQVYEPFSLDA